MCVCESSADLSLMCSENLKLRSNKRIAFSCQEDTVSSLLFNPTSPSWNLCIYLLIFFLRATWKKCPWGTVEYPVKVLMVHRERRLSGISLFDQSFFSALRSFQLSSYNALSVCFVHSGGPRSSVPSGQSTIWDWLSPPSLWQQHFEARSRHLITAATTNIHTSSVNEKISDSFKCTVAAPCLKKKTLQFLWW